MTVWRALHLLFVLAIIARVEEAAEVEIVQDAAGNLVLGTAGAGASGLVVNGRDFGADLSSCERVHAPLGPLVARADAHWTAASDLSGSAGLAIVRAFPLGPYGKLYVVGGFKVSALDVVDVFDGQTWSRISARLKTPRNNPRVFPFRGFLYACGGQVSGPNSVERFDGREWTIVTNVRTSRADFAAVAFQDRLFVLGGFIGNTVQKIVESYDGESWRAEAPMLLERAFFAVVAYKGRLYAIGGMSNLMHENAVEHFDGASWARAPSMSTARSRPGVAVFRNFVYVTGGLSSSFHTTVERFDGTTWSLQPSMHVARMQHACFTFGSQLYVLGGEKNDTSVSVEVMGETSETWTQLPTLLMLPRASYNAAVYTI
jgi:hypothetical protein